MSAQISLDLQQIEERALSQSFERGKELYERGAIFLPIRRRNMLSAQCVGSDSNYSPPLTKPAN